MSKGCLTLAILFVVAGAMHFALTPAYVKIVPSYLPLPTLLVQVSGFAEIAGGLGLLYPPTRQTAAWGLVALLVCVLPANLNMAMNPRLFPSIPVWVLWSRVPMQLPLIGWAWLYARRQM